MESAINSSLVQVEFRACSREGEKRNAIHYFNLRHLKTSKHP